MILTNEQTVNLNQVFYWLNDDGEPETSLAHIEMIESFGIDTCPDEIKALASVSYRVWEYSSQGQGLDDPRNLIFPTQLDNSLDKRTKIYLGERIESVYQDYDTSEPVVRVSYKFERDEKGLLIKRIQTIEYYLTDGTIGQHKKILIDQNYNAFEQSGELASRRENILLEVMSIAKEVQFDSYVADLYAKKADLVQAYRQVGSKGLFDYLKSNQFLTDCPWGNAPTTDNKSTIQAFLAGYFSLGTV
jgi:hypothetical protein